MCATEPMIDAPKRILSAVESNPALTSGPHSRPRDIAMNASLLAQRKFLALSLGIGALVALSACSSVTPLTKERVAKGDTSVQQAQQTLGQSEHGAMELQQARDKIAAAKSAVAKNKDQEAQRLAAQAHLYAELAIAKSQSASTRKSADEVLASVETLRQEAERNSPTTR
jgi:hypothetical protein